MRMEDFAGKLCNLLPEHSMGFNGFLSCFFSGSYLPINLFRSRLLVPHMGLNRLLLDVLQSGMMRCQNRAVFVGNEQDVFANPL